MQSQQPQQPETPTEKENIVTGPKEGSLNKKRKFKEQQSDRDIDDNDDHNLKEKDIHERSKDVNKASKSTKIKEP